MTKCTYCESTEHNIKNCPNDSDLYNSLVVKADKLPKFESMTYKVLKKLAALSGNKSSLPKVQLIIILTKVWEKMNEEKKALEEETSCPICFLDFTHKNVCVTKCGHKFCLECILTHHKRKNDCPLCRAELCKPIKTSRPKPIIRQVTPEPFDTEDAELLLSFSQQEIDPQTGLEWTQVSVGPGAVRIPVHYHQYHRDFHINRMFRQMECYDSFERYYEDFWIYGNNTVTDGAANNVSQQEWNLELLERWMVVHPESMRTMEIGDPEMYFDRLLSGEQSLSNVTIRDTTIMHESIDDLIDLMETHNEIVELFENDPILSQQSQRINL